MRIEDRRKLKFKKFISSRGQERFFVRLPKCIVGLVNLLPLNHLMVIGPIYVGKFHVSFEEENIYRQTEEG